MNKFTYSDFIHVQNYLVPSSVSRKLRLQAFASKIGWNFDNFEDSIIKDLYTVIIDIYDDCKDRWQVARNTRLKNKLFASEKFVESLKQVYN